VVTPDRIVLPLMALGWVMLMLWQGWGRLAGVPVVALTLLLWVQTERPDVLISEDGALVGVMTADGRALNRERGGGFVARDWLESDGDKALQEEAAARWALVPDLVPELVTLRGKRAAENLRDCEASQIVVLNVNPPAQAARALPCAMWYPDRLRSTGSVALYHLAEGTRQLTARDITGHRLWNASGSRVAHRRGQ
jgi:competence protein ComEC